ncbi:MAG: hypothetical protein ABIP88_01165, partial [Candidatus Binatia bacterium]
MSEKFSAEVSPTLAVDAPLSQIASIKPNLKPRSMDDNSVKQMSTLLFKNLANLDYLAAIQ